MANAATGSTRRIPMSPKIIAVAEKPRPLEMCASVIKFIPCAMKRLMIGMFFVVGVANAQDHLNSPPKLEGRWVAQHRSLVLDISRCGKGWCGVEVISGGTCGKTVLRLEITKLEKEFDQSLLGLLELSTEALPYSVEVSYLDGSGGER